MDTLWTSFGPINILFLNRDVLNIRSWNIRFWNNSIWKMNFLWDDFALGLRNELLGGPLCWESHLLPWLCPGVIDEFDKGTLDKGGRADEVDHRWHREPTGSPHLLDGACVFLVEVDQESEHCYPKDEIGKVEKVVKDEFRPRYLDLSCELPSVCDLFRWILKWFTRQHLI